MVTFEEILEKAKAVPDEKFPNFLMDTQFRMYEDNPNYFYEYDMDDPRLTVLETVPKLRDYYRWEDLTKIWYSYMEDKAKERGITIEMLYQLAMLGVLDDFIPDKPEMRPKEWKRIEKNGVPTRKMYSPSVEVDMINLMSEMDAEEEPSIRNIPASGVTPEIEPQTRQDTLDATRALNTIASAQRQLGFRRSKSLDLTGIGLSAVESAFYAQPEETYQIDINQAIKDSYEEELMTEAERFAASPEGLENGLGALWKEGRFFRQESAERLEFMKRFQALGYDAWGLYDRKRMSKDEINLIETSIPALAQVSDKKRKKLHKKQQKQAQAHRNRLNSLASVLTANGYSYGASDEDDVPPFQVNLEDIYRT